MVWTFVLDKGAQGMRQNQCVQSSYPNMKLRSAVVSKANANLNHANVHAQDLPRVVRDAEAILIAAGAGMGVDSGCRTSMGPRGSGGPIPRQSGLDYPLKTWPTRDGSTNHRALHGPSTGTGWASIAPRNHTGVLDRFVNGPSDFAMGPLSSHPMSMANSKRQAFQPIASWNAMDRFTTRSARSLVVQTSPMHPAGRWPWMPRPFRPTSRFRVAHDATG